MKDRVNPSMALQKITMGSRRQLLTTSEDSGFEGGPNQMENTQNNTAEVAEDKDANAFSRSSRLTRSPVETFSIAAANNSGTPRGGQHGLFGAKGVTSQMSTPSGSTIGGPPPSTPGSSTTQEGLQLGRRKVSVMELSKKVTDLHDYVKGRGNVHHEIKQKVTSLKYAVLELDREQTELRKRAETAEKALKLALEQLAAMEASAKQQETPKGRRKKSSSKRDRETPGEEEDPKKTKNAQDNEQGAANGEQSKGENDQVWTTVTNRKVKPKKQSEKKETGEERPKKDKGRPRREWSKGDAILVTANDQTTYAEILRKVRDDPNLKDLGENVVRTRRTQKGEMLFELKKDAAIKSSAYQGLVAESLGNDASVKALTQETVVGCKYLDEITTVDELERELRTQCNLDKNESMTIRLTKSYDGTQSATIRLPVATANRLVEKGKVRIGWSVCPLRLVTRTERRTMRCFKCMGFGHQAASCEGPDRTQLCRRCGEEGHFGKDCKKRPKCLLCKPEEGNAHSTGSLRCRAYKKAIAAQQ